MKNLLLLSIIINSLIGFSITKNDELHLIKDITGLKTFTRNQYNQNKKFSKVASVCVDIEDSDSEPTWLYNSDSAGISDHCCIKVQSNSSTVKAGLFIINHDKKSRVHILDIFDSSDNSRRINSDAVDGSAYLDIICSNTSMNPLKNFSIRDINKILKNYVEL